MRMRLSAFGPMLLAALITIGAGCAATEPTPVEQGMPVPGTQTPETEANGSAAGTQLEGTPAENDAPEAPIDLEAASVKTFIVTGSSFSFDVKEMRVKKGDKVRIVFKNAEGFHDWVVDEFNARSAKLQAGGTETVEFTADKSGTFEYYCSVGQHRANGMKGNLIVE
ncbi:MAG: plastocyanin/azurin family copper-binding protein [Patescibacteria group bacterium]